MIESQEQALAEARRRWGDCADVWERPLGEFWVSDGYPAWRAEMLGRGDPICGNGSSWEAAFADADKREGK